MAPSLPAGYRFRGTFSDWYVVRRGEPAPDGAIRATIRRLWFDVSAATGRFNKSEPARMLRELGLEAGRGAWGDSAGHRRLVERMCDEIAWLFDVYEVRRRRVIVSLDTPEEAVLGPDSSLDSLDSKSWIGLTLIDQDGAPVPGRSYRIVIPGGTTLNGTLDSNGSAIVRNLDPGNCQIWCPYVEPHPTTTYTVARGDHISGIAQRFGFDDCKTVWNDPGNADLQQQRTDPHVLQPGDSLSIPEATAQPAANKPTGAKHPFQIQRSPLRIRLKLLDLAVKPLAGVQVTLAADTVTTDGEGLVEATVDKNAKDAPLDTPFSPEVDLSVGDLNPSDDTSDSGYKARLYNLGFLWDPTVDETDAEMLIALEDFQAQYALPISGQLDDATKAQLLQAHGC
jgi:N-acetylmuramoyl-L-alanine amidase